MPLGRKNRGTTHLTAKSSHSRTQTSPQPITGRPGFITQQRDFSQNRLRKQSVFLSVLPRSKRQLSGTSGKTFFPSLSFSIQLSGYYHNPGLMSTDHGLSASVFFLFSQMASGAEFIRKRKGKEIDKNVEFDIIYITLKNAWKGSFAV